jgi:hypothetical protein
MSDSRLEYKPAQIPVLREIADMLLDELAVDDDRLARPSEAVKFEYYN